MTIGRVSFIYCDHPNCDREYEWTAFRGTEVRKTAKADGWTSAPGGRFRHDFCPIHAKDAMVAAEALR